MCKTLLERGVGQEGRHQNMKKYYIVTYELQSSNSASVCALLVVGQLCMMVVHQGCGDKRHMRIQRVVSSCLVMSESSLVKKKKKKTTDRATGGLIESWDIQGVVAVARIH